MNDRNPLAASSFWFLVGALGIFVGVAALLLIPSLSEYFFARRVLLRVGFIVLAVVFAFFSACGSVLGFLAETAPGRRDGVAGALIFLIGVASLIGIWLTRIA